MTNRFAPLRAMVALFLTDTCTIAEPGAIFFDEDAGHDDIEPGAELYAGACRLSPAGNREVDAGDTVVPLRMFNVFLPWDTVGVEVDQVVTITASTDPHLIDRQLRVVDVQGMTDGAYRQLLCEDAVDVTQPEVGS